MSETTNREGFGIAELVAEREGTLAPSLIPPEEPPAQQPAERDAAEVAAEDLRRQAEQYRAQLADAQRRAHEEGQRRVQAEQELQRTRQTAADDGFASITSALAARESERTSLTNELKAALGDGNHERVADIQVRLGELGSELFNLRQGKEAYEAERANRLSEPPKPAAPPPPPAEGTTVGMSREQFMAGRTPKTQEWLRKNDQFFTDSSFFNRVIGADALAYGKGYVRDSDDYFRFVDEQVGNMTQPAAKPRGNGAPPAAPPSRDAQGPSGRPNLRSGDTYVTPQQRRVAAWMFDKMPGGFKPEDAEEYAREERALRTDGEIPHKRR